MVIVTCLYPQKTAICPFVRLSDFWSNDIILYDLSLCPFVPFFVNEGQEGATSRDAAPSLIHRKSVTAGWARPFPRLRHPCHRV